MAKSITQAHAAIITAICTLISAVATALITTRSADRLRQDSVDNPAPVVERLAKALGAGAGYSTHIYPDQGFGILAPSAWSVSDEALKYGAGQFDITQRIEDEKNALGLSLRIVPVPKEYITDIPQQIKNQMDLLKARIDTNAVVSDISIDGRPGKEFRFSNPTGKRIGDTRWYWLRLFPEVQIQIVCFTYADSKDRDEFWREVEKIVQSIRIDQNTVNEKRMAIWKK